MKSSNLLVLTVTV